MVVEGVVGFESKDIDLFIFFEAREGGGLKKKANLAEFMGSGASRDPIHETAHRIEMKHNSPRDAPPQTLIHSHHYVYM